MKILFRCDAGAIRGSGHLVRCLTLADALVKQGGQVFFACRKDAGPFLDLFKNRSFNLLTMPEPDTDLVTTEQIWSDAEQVEDFKICQSTIPDQTFDWVIVDHYALSASWETLAREIGKKIFVIDDLANRPHDCDLLLDQNEYADKDDRYKRFVPSSCRMLLGGQYVLLRDEFSIARKNIEYTRKNAGNVVILMGGSDYHGQSLRIGKILGELSIPEQFSVDIILGQQNEQRNEIEALAASNRSLRVHKNQCNISSLLLKADIAFGAGGTSTWEFACLGVPLLMVTFAQNQIKMAQDAETAGFAKYIGHFNEVSDSDIARCFKELITNYAERENMHARGLSLVDGDGVKKIAEFIVYKDGAIIIRKANADDCRDVFEWRNDILTSEMSLQSDPISFESHKVWFDQSLARHDKLLLVAEMNGQKIGIVRFDLTAMDAAMASINLNPAWRGRGLGKRLLLEAEESLPSGIKRILAEIKAANIPSQHAFEQAGYKSVENQTEIHRYLKYLHN